MRECGVCRGRCPGRGGARKKNRGERWSASGAPLDLYRGGTLSPHRAFSSTRCGQTGQRGDLGRESSLRAARHCPRRPSTPFSAPPPARQHSDFRRRRLNANLMWAPDGPNGLGGGGGTAREPLLVAPLTERQTRYGVRRASPACTGRPPRTARVARGHSGASEQVWTVVTSHGGRLRQRRRAARWLTSSKDTARPRMPRAATDVVASAIWVRCSAREWSTHSAETALLCLSTPHTAFHWSTQLVGRARKGPAGLSSRHCWRTNLDTVEIRRPNRPTMRIQTDSRRTHEQLRDSSVKLEENNGTRLRSRCATVCACSRRSTLVTYVAVSLVAHPKRERLRDRPCRPPRPRRLPMVFSSLQHQRADAPVALRPPCPADPVKPAVDAISLLLFHRGPSRAAQDGRPRRPQRLLMVLASPQHRLATAPAASCPPCPTNWPN